MEEHVRQGNSKCKGPVAEVRLEYSGNRVEAGVPGAKLAKEVGEGRREKRSET